MYVTNDLLFRGINRGRGAIGTVFAEAFAEIGVVVVVVDVVPETLLLLMLLKDATAGGTLRSSS
jgi:hypothetical protein